MAKVFATRAYDMTALNLHALDTLADLTAWTDTSFAVKGTAYPDGIEAVLKDGSGSLIFGSQSLVGTPDGDVLGQINGIFQTSSAAKVWSGIQGFSIDIHDVAAAWETPGTKDDMALLKRILSKADSFDLSEKSDVAKGFGGNDMMDGNGGADRLWGGGGSDTVRGGAGDDRLWGNEGNDTLKAGTGRDVLTGGGGKDILVGGTDADADRFVFTDWIDSGPGSSLRDEIRNFTRKADKIDLRLMDADEGSSGTHEDFDWSGTKADDFSVWWKATDAGVLLRADVSGDAIHEFEILVRGVSSLSESDLLL